MVTHDKVIRTCALVPRMEPSHLYWLCQQMPEFITGCLFTLSYPIFSYPLAIYKMCYSLFEGLHLEDQQIKLLPVRQRTI